MTGSGAPHGATPSPNHVASPPRRTSRKGDDRPEHRAGSHGGVEHADARLARVQQVDGEHD
jgi:hypothetical protein